MKEIINRFVVRPLAAGKTGAACFKLALLAAVALFAEVAGAQTNFANPAVIVGDFGSLAVDNTGVVPEAGTPTIAGVAPSHTIWFQWSTTNSGEVVFDTMGSVLPAFSYPLDTVMGAYSGTNLVNLGLLAANDEMNGSPQYNYSYQIFYSFGDTNFSGSSNAPVSMPYYSSSYNYSGTGPSQLRFNAQAYTTYYIAVDTKIFPGLVSLNWALHPSGVFRFASEDADALGAAYDDGTPMLLYKCAATESTLLSTRSDEPIRFSYLNGGYANGTAGMMVTVTRVGGASGRVQVAYTTSDIDTNSDPNGALLQTNGFLVNGDLPAVSTKIIETVIPYYTNAGGTVFTYTNRSTRTGDYTPISGTLTFDDYEMSKTIVVPINNYNSSSFRPRLNRDFLVLLTNAVVDSAESTAIPQPRLDLTYSKALVRILDVNVDPKTYSIGFQTNIDLVAGTTNIVTLFSTTPTNAVFNFQKAHYKVYRAGGNETFTIYVSRTGTNLATASIGYRVNSLRPFVKNTGAQTDNMFPLQPGSDYATSDPVNSTVIREKTPDFSFPGGYDGTLSWGDKDFDPKPIEIKVYDNGLQQFNEDFKISLYDVDNNGNPFPVGMVTDCSVTILNARDLVVGDSNTNQLFPPAGSVDELYNPDYAYQYWLNTDPLDHPGTDGVVYGLAHQPDGKTVVVGDFFTYNGFPSLNIARVDASGYFDPTFNVGSGADNFIHSVLLTANNQIVIGGNFTSYGGSDAYRIALLNSDGSLDSAFNANTGAGFDGPVQGIVQQPDGKLLVGGDFNSFNGTARNYLARLNADGSLDNTFDAGTNLNGAVLALALQPNGQIVIGGSFTNLVGVVGQSYVGRINADGSVDNAFDPGAGADGDVSAVAIQPDGEIIIGGSFTKVNGKNLPHLARLFANGLLDTGFNCLYGADGPVYNLFVATNAIVTTTNYSTVVQTNFTIYVGGQFQNLNGTHRLGYGRLNADGSVDTTFMDTAYNQFAGLTRPYFGDRIGAVMATAVQPDGNVLIGGTFDQIGGGEFNLSVRADSFIGAYTNNPFPRSAIRNRSNVARLIGGATPGPGNIGLAAATFSVNKSATSKFVALTRTNGFLGTASANFSVVPGLAQNGIDYLYDGDYNGTTPLYISAWSSTRMHSDGLYGGNSVLNDDWGHAFSAVVTAKINVTITGNTNNYSDVNAQLLLSNPLDDGQFFLGGENIPLGVALGGCSAPLTIIEDRHQSGTFGFNSPSYSGTGPLVGINLLRTNGTYGSVVVKCSTTTNGSTAVLGVDYKAVSDQQVTFGASDTIKSFNVTILNSNYNSSVEKTVNLFVSSVNPPANGIAFLGLTNATLHIINPNFQGFLSLGTNQYSTKLSAGSVAFTVARTVGNKGTITNQYCTVNGTAQSGVDFVGVTNYLTWNNGDASTRTITVPLLNNGLVGTNRQFSIQLFNPSVNGVATPALFASTSFTNALVTITNDNTYGTFQFGSANYVVNEDGGYATVSVTRTGATNGLVYVKFATADGLAAAGVNYYATNGTLAFQPGQLGASFNVFIKPDGVANPAPDSFFFTASLTTTNGGAFVGSPATTAIHIVDNSLNRPPGNNDTSFGVGSGMNGDVLALALQTSGKIIAGGNFTTVNGIPEYYLARLNGDGSLDYTGFLYGLTGFNSTVYTLAVQTDDKILVGGAFTTVNGIVRNRITRLLTDGTQDSSFNPGSGANNTVYSLAETFVGGVRKVYAAGTFTTINGVTRPRIARLNDVGTADTAFDVGTGPNAAVYAVAAYPTNSVFAGKILIGGAFTNINGFAAGRIARLNVDGSVDASFNVQVSADDAVRTIAIQGDGRVLFGGDFTHVNTSALSHVARLNADGSLDTSFVGTANGGVSAIVVQPDSRIVLAGQFSQAGGVTRNNITRLLPGGLTDPTINFGSGANGAISAVALQPGDQMLVLGGGFTTFNGLSSPRLTRVYGGSVTGSGAFEFSAASYQVNENGIQASIGIRRTGGTSGPNLDGSGSVAVNFATSAGDTNPAVVGVNYQSVNQSVIFPPGEVYKEIPVTVMQDSNITANLNVKLTLSNPTPPTSLGDQAGAVLTIINVDSSVSFEKAAYSVSKDILTGMGTLNVVRLGTTVGTSTVQFFTTTNGTAQPGSDFYPTNGTLTFNPGESIKPIYVSIINSGVFTGDRTVSVTLSNAVGSTLYAPSNSVLTIQESVKAPGSFRFSTTSYTVNSGNGFAYLTVLRTNGTTGSITVGYTTVAGTAQPGVDYVDVNNGSVTFPDGTPSQTIAIELKNSTVAKPAVSFSVYLANPPGQTNVVLTDPTNAIVTIINTNNGVGFVSATNVVDEAGGSALLYVQRYGSTTSTTTVKYGTTNGTALAGVNYQAASGTVTFFPGEVQKPINVTLLKDPAVTGDLTFNIGLTQPSSGTMLVAPAVTTVLVQDADAGFSFTNATMSVAKNAGHAVITVVCSNPRVEPVLTSTNIVPLQVTYSTADGTAHAGSEYEAVSGILIFTNGIGTNTFEVPIDANNLVTGDRTFTVSLSNPTAPGQLKAPSTQTVVILDNNTGVSFSKANYTAFKNGVTAAIDVYRTGYTDSIVSIDFYATNGTAVSGVNFVSTNGTLTFTNGVTKQTFQVPLIAGSTVQPNLTVLLQLLNPVNCSQVTPRAATLTLLENSGSYVVPAGAQVVTNYTSHSADGIIHTNDTVKVLFGFRVGAGLNVANLTAKLLETNGVTLASNGVALLPNPYPQVYGPLTTYGHSVSMPFVFTAKGTNALTITPTFALYDNGNYLGTAVFGFTLGTWTTTFASTNRITINDLAAASPYPSTISVSGVGGLVVKATVTLTNLTHASSRDISALVVSPTDKSTLLMSWAGGVNLVKAATLTFDDASTNSLPYSTPITTGTNKPTSYLTPITFP